jgi:radical SAM superfamily enzyme YgiQ (UPF0313 family)
MRLTLVDNLVFPVGRQHSDFDVHPNIGLASLAAIVRLAGHDVRIVDPKREVKQGRLRLGSDLYLDAAEALLVDRPDAVGFTTLGCSFIFTARVAEHLKRIEPDLPILLGGPHATVLDRTIMEAFDAFDVIVRHEAEETINPVLEALDTRRFTGIPGVTYRTGRTALGIRSNPGAPKIEDLDTLPFPAYDLYPVEELELPYLRIEAGRGCPWACTFCSTATFFQRSYRLKTPGRLVADLDALHNRYGHTSFKLEHDLFTVNKRKVAAFCEAVKDRNYAWMASARIDCVDEPLLELMAESGCRQLYFGVETGSTTLQKSLHKRLDLTLLGPVLRKAGELGIEAVTSFITGFPAETEHDLDDTLSLIGTLVSDYEPAPTAQLHLLLPEPGTGEFATHGHALAFDGHVAEFNAEPHRNDHELIVRHPQIFATYHYYPGVVAREQQIAVVEITRQLLSLGPLVLREMLRVGRLDFAALVRDICQCFDGRHDRDAVLHDVAHRFGRDHFLTSLVRFLVGLATTRATRPPPSGDDSGAALVLSPHAVLFDDLHDCARILEHLTNRPGQALPADLIATRHDYLAVRTAQGVRLFEVDPLTHLIGSAFAIPATAAAVAERLGEQTGRDVPVDGVVERLLHAQALVLASSTRTATLAAAYG